MSRKTLAITAILTAFSSSALAAEKPKWEQASVPNRLEVVGIGGTLGGIGGLMNGWILVRTSAQGSTALELCGKKKE